MRKKFHVKHKVGEGMRDNYDLIVVGGGAAGLFAAAYQAVNVPDMSVLLVEKNDRVGKKLLTTGNGRCNISNSTELSGKYHGAESFAEDVFRAFPREETLEFFEQIGIPVVEEENGKLFPRSLQAGSVVDMLRLKAEEGADVLCSAEVSGVGYDGNYTVTTDKGIFTANNVLITCGGRAAANTGSDGSGYELLSAFGHRVNRTFPAIVQLTADTKKTKLLAGIKWVCGVTARAGRQSRTELGEVLFTDYGLSGPPVLQVSRIISKNGSGQIILDLCPDLSKQQIESEIAARAAAFSNRDCMELLTGFINKRLGQTAVKCAGIPLSTRCSALGKKEISNIADCLKGFTVEVNGTKGWNMAQVTAGGIDPFDFSADTMESRLYEGLYAAGEILDVDGDCGGYNLQWAWSTAGTAIKAIINKMRKNNA